MNKNVLSLNNFNLKSSSNDVNIENKTSVKVELVLNIIECQIWNVSWMSNKLQPQYVV